ncbi:MAG: class II fructose-bisphosphate aldolase [Clostridia bacterium]|nr:class II fructose-bisphosphate aldolase [Clostridia bacterium]
MLVNFKDVLADAKKNNYGVGLFNTVNLEMAKGVLAAAEELRAPVIIGSAEVLLNCSELQELADMLKPMAERATVPVVLHLDHGLTEARVKEAISLGFTSVMYDCSSKPYEENKKALADIVKLAHAHNITVEGELGHVGSNANAADHNIYTDPLQAKDFAEATGVDALAVAIGTAHGVYKEKPVLDIQRLREIAEVVDVPLVLHGGSGLTDDDFRNVIKNGISKVNIFTDINTAFCKYVHDNWTENLGHTKLMPGAIDAVKQVVMNKIKLFGSDGKY